MSTSEALAKMAEQSQVEIPQDARDKARELKWDDGLIELALSSGHTLQEVWQALRGGVNGETAKQFLAGGSMVRPDFWWMKVPTEWGIRARPADKELGLTIGDLNIGTYGDIPDTWTNRSEIARGSFPNPVVEDMGYTIFEKAFIWADCVVPLYEIAIRDRWISSTDLRWASLEALPDGVEGHARLAVAHLAQRLLERALAAEVLHAYDLDRSGGRRGGGSGQSLALECVGIHEEPSVPTLSAGPEGSRPSVHSSSWRSTTR